MEGLGEGPPAQMLHVSMHAARTFAVEHRPEELYWAQFDSVSVSAQPGAGVGAGLPPVQLWSSPLMVLP